MSTESMQRLLATPLEGRVVSQTDDPRSKYTDFDGNPTILYPWSEKGLQQAVQLRESLGERGFLRSGLSASGDGRRSAQGGLVVDLSHFSDIEITQAPEVDAPVMFTVGAAAKTSQLADELVRANAFLPLGDNPVKSVVSSLLADEPGYFDRSMGHLRDYVDALHVVTPQGDAVRIERGDDTFDSMLEGVSGGVIQTIVFAAVPAARQAIRVVRASFVYTHRDFEAALGLLRHDAISETMDVSVHAHHDAYGLGLVSVTVAGLPADRDRADAVLDAMTALHQQSRGKGWSMRQSERMVHRVEARSPAEIIELVLEGGMSGNPYVDRNLVCTHHRQTVALDDFDTFQTSFMKSLEDAFGSELSGASPDVLGSVRLSLGPDADLAVDVHVFLPRTPSASETTFVELSSRALGVPVQSKPQVAAMKRFQGKPITELNVSSLQSTAFDVGARRIPGFEGPIYAPGDPDYDAKRTQYASSSYADKQGPGGSMRPFLVAYPRKNSNDVAAAITFAKNEGKHLVARSGGHQYSGLSSGGDDTILLSMDLYDDLEVQERDGKTFARVGVGRLLTDIAAELKRNGVTIPHGECPRVGIGGHAQTGGYGHILRSYGLAIDHVHEFKIHLHDGGLRVVRRPDSRDDNGLYWAVLGGGPGSFGILTEITFECIRDTDHPNSWGSAKTFVYGKNLFRGAMKEIQRWTEQIAAGSPDLPSDVDLCVTVVNVGSSGLAALLLEMVDGNRDGGNGTGNRDHLLQAQERILDHRRWWNAEVPCRGYQGRRTLSFMSDAKVRRTGTTEDGREFAEPYKKRLNCSKQPLEAGFVEGFVDLVERVVKSKTVKIVFQMFLGGGAYRTPQPDPPLSSICHRDVTVGIVFDCFYVGKRGLNNARRFQAEMQELLEQFSGDQEIRMLWGSFGDTDISNDAIRKLYYDDATWSSLQAVKLQVDAEDLFHTEFTVQLP